MTVKRTPTGDVDEPLTTAIEEVLATPRLTIHYARKGHPLCGLEVPLDALWPAGHDWVSGANHVGVTCLVCRAKLDAEQEM